MFGIKDTLCGPLLRSGAVLPMEIQTTLLPFRGRIVYDGVSIAASNGTCCISQISRLPVLPLTLVTVRTDYPDCCPYIVQYTPNKWTDTFLFGKKDGVPALDLEKDMRITTKLFRSLTSKIDRLTGMLSKHPLASDPDDAQLSIVFLSTSHAAH